MPLLPRALVACVWFLVILGALVFPASGSLGYRQGWWLIADLGVCVLLITLWMGAKHSDLLERRMKAGSGAETRPKQKRLQAVNSLFALALISGSALDHRLSGSYLGSAWVGVGHALIVLGFIGLVPVFDANPYAGGTIEIRDGQRLADRGPYRFVRHPMYSCSLVAIFGVPLALGSLWGLLAAGGLLIGIAVRIGDEESELRESLPGYADYAGRVRFRLIPGIW